MRREKYPSENADRFIIRLPDGLRETIKTVAAENRRSMNAEVVFHLERIFDHETEKGQPAA